MSETSDKGGLGPTDEPEASETEGEAETETEAEAEAEAETETDTESAGEVDLAALAGEDEDDDERARAAEEDALDLDDLDAVGVDGVVARLRGADDDDVQTTMAKLRPPRSPIISVLVVAVGAYLLITMFSDFRYWLRSSEPDVLGHASTLLADGRTLDAYDNHYVVLEGTPDVQHAVRLTTKENFVGYLRVTEGGGGLFAAIPRSKDEVVYDTFDGRYQGRLRRLEDDRAFEWLQQFYAQQKVPQIVDLATEGTVQALRAGSTTLPVAEADGGGERQVGTAEMLRLVFEGDDARVQLDSGAFPTAEAAEEAIASLGYPYVGLARVQRSADNRALFGDDYHRFVVRIPEAEREAAKAKLAERATQTQDKVGAFVLGLPATYTAAAGDIRIAGDTVVFPYGDNTTSPGYEVRDGRLVERELDETLALPLATLHAVRLERTIEIDPDGFVVSVDEDPSSQWMAAVLWLLVLAITGANAASLALWWRRRPA